MASHVNEMASAIIAIETLLGGFRAAPVEDEFTLADGHILVWNDSEGEWQAQAPSSGATDLQEAYNGGQTVTVTADTPIALTTSGVGQNGITVYDGTNTTSIGTCITTNCLKTQNGSAGAPAFAPNGDPTTGIYFDGSGDIIFASGGSEVYRVNASGVTAAGTTVSAVPDGTPSLPSMTFSGELDKGFYSPGTGQIGIATDGASIANFNGVMDAATGNEVAYDFTPTVNKAVSGDYTAWRLNVTETLAPGSNNILAEYAVDGNPMMQLTSGGELRMYPAGTQEYTLAGGGIVYEAGLSEFSILSNAAALGAAATPVTIEAGEGGAANGSAGEPGAPLISRGGLGGDGDATFAAGAGGHFYGIGGQAGNDGGGGAANGGNAYIDGASPNGGLAGSVYIGTTDAATINSGHGAGIKWTHTGNIQSSTGLIVGTDATGAKALTLWESASDPSAVSDQGQLYTIQDGTSGYTELAFRNSNGDITQITGAEGDLGGGSVSDPLQLNDNNATTPTYSFSTQTDSGMYLADSTNPTVGLSVEGGAAMLVKRVADLATGNEVLFDLAGTVNKATSGNYAALRVTITQTAAPGSDNRLLDLVAAGSDQLYVTAAGQMRTSQGTTALPAVSYRGSTGTGISWASDEMWISTGGTARWVATNTLLRPATTGAVALGTTSLRWNGVYTTLVNSSGSVTIGTDATGAKALTLWESASAPANSADQGQVYTRQDGTSGYTELAFRNSNGDITQLTGAEAPIVTASAAFAADNVILKADGTGRGSQATGITCADTTNNLTGLGTLNGIRIPDGEDADITGTTHVLDSDNLSRVSACTNAAGCTVTVNTGAAGTYAGFYATTTDQQVTIADGTATRVALPSDMTAVSRTHGAIIWVYYLTASEYAVMGALDPV